MRRLLTAAVLLTGCHDKAAVKVTIDCDAYVAHMETVIASHIDTYEGSARERARQHFAEANPQARAELLAKCKAIDTTTADKLDCVMSARTPTEVSACPDL